MVFRRIPYVVLQALLNLEFFVKKVKKFFFFTEIPAHDFIDSDYLLARRQNSKLNEKDTEFVFKEKGKGEYGYRYRARYELHLTNVVANSVSGNVYLDGNRFVKESSSWPSSEISKDSYNGSDIFKYYSSVNYKYKENSVILPSSNFYHWLIEDLPRFLFTYSYSYNEFVTIVHWASPRYVLDIVKILNLNLNYVPRIVTVPKLILASKNPETGYPNPYDIQLLRKLLLPRELESGVFKIYVSRLNSSRSPKWEKQLIAILKDEGWKIVQCEKLSLMNQISVFAQGSVICGVHGAGLSGIAWAKGKIQVIELRQSFRSDCFLRLSQVLGLRHFIIETDSKSVHDIARKIFEIAQ